MSQLDRDALKDQQLCTSRFQCQRVVEQRLRRVAAALHFIAAENIDRLWGQTKVAANRHRAFRQHFHRFRKPGAAFKLDHVGACAHHNGGVSEGLFRGGVGHKRQVSEQQAMGGAATYRLGVVGDIFHGHRQGRVVPLHRHAQRVTYQHHVDPFIGKQLCKAVVIGGDGGEALLLLFAFLQQGDSGRFHNVS